MSGVRAAIARFVPWREAGREALYAGIAGVISLIIAIIAMRITPEELDLRWSYGGADQVLHYVIFSSAADVFPYGANPGLGFPHAQNLYFAPLFDLWSAIFVSGLGRFVNDGIVLLNLYNLLTYFTAGVAAYLFFRALRVSRWVSLVFAVIFATVPFHFIQAAGHPFLASYWPVPLIGILVLMVAGPSANPFESWISSADTAGMRRARRWIPILVLAVTIGLSQSYYYVFAALIVGGVWIFVAIRALVAREARSTLLWPSISLGALYAVIGTQLLVLSMNWGDRYERYFSARLVGESELYGGKLVTLLFPWTESGLPFLGRFLASYSVQPFVADTGEGPWMATIPILGIVLLTVWTLVRLLHRGPFADTALGRFMDDRRVGVLSVAFLWSLFFYLTTGLGAIFAFLVSPEIRAWSRLAIVLTLLGLAFLALFVTALAKRPRVLVAVMVALSVIAIVDQTTTVSRAVPIAATDDYSLREFVAAGEELLADDCGVVQLPIKGFPETGTIGRMGDYDQGLAAVYTQGDSLRYSYGAVRGTHSAEYWLSATTPSRFEVAIDDTRTCAIMVDTFAYIDDPNATAEPPVDWTRLVESIEDPGEPDVVSSDGRYLLFEVAR